MDFLRVFDAYSLRARLFPAIIAVAPALAALALLVSWETFGVSTVIASVAVAVLLFAIADFARARGRAIEGKLYAEGGKPSITMFRRNDSTLDEGLKERYRKFLAGKLGIAMPSATAERADQIAADSFYEQCGVWLRAHTRDSRKFALLFNENVTYGFRRNLLGFKWLALMLNMGVVVVCFLLLFLARWNLEYGLGWRAAVVLIIAGIHAVYIFVAVRKANVLDASKAYARELILSSEAFINAPAAQKPPSPSRKRTSKPDVE